MSKVSRDKKKAEAKAEAKGKQAKIAKSKVKKTESTAEVQVEAKYSKIKNYGFCCTCKQYSRKAGITYPCKKTGKYTARKATCESYGYKA